MQKNFKRHTLVTGSSGYVASSLMPALAKTGFVTGIDELPGTYTNIVGNIVDIDISFLKKDLASLTVVNLAAARFDFGVKAKDYYKKNLVDHSLFLKKLSAITLKRFIHVSSVAALDGRNISYSDNLDCDDAYRSTKYLQEVMVKKWCDEHGVPLTILYPSAIFSDDQRLDTNIGKLQSISQFIPFIPKIEVIKSLTYLPFFSKFIIDSVAGEISTGKYLTIEKPLLTVSKMIQFLSGRSIKIVRIPFLSAILKILAYFFYVLGFFGRIDFKLTPNRVVKLFSDTSYSHTIFEDIDIETYTSRNCEELPEILKKYTQKDKK